MNKHISLLFLPFLLAICILAGGCSSHKRSVRRHHDRPVKEYFHAGSEKNISAVRRAIVKASKDWLGTPYKYGANRCGHGSDCSGMVVTVYDEEAGIKLPRSSREMAEYCKSIKASQVLPGDLVFFATGKDPDRISHVGIMLDNTYFMHISSSKGGVVSDVTTPYYQRTFKGYGRVPSLK